MNALLVAGPVPLVPACRFELATQQNVFITETRQLDTPHSDSLLPEGFYGQHRGSLVVRDNRAGGAVGGRRTLHEWTRRRNIKQSEVLAILDNTANYALTVNRPSQVVTRGDTLPALAADEVKASNTLIQECVGYLDTRAAFWRGELTTSWSTPAALEPAPLQTGFGANPARQQLSPMVGGHQTMPAPTRVRRVNGVRGKVEMLKADAHKLRDFFEEVDELKKRKASEGGRKGQDHLKHHLETVGVDYRPSSVCSRRQAQQEGHKQRTAQAREKAFRLTEEKIGRTMSLLNIRDHRLAAFEERKNGGKLQSVELRSAFWSVVLHFISSARVMAQTVTRAKQARDVVTADDGQHDKPQAVSITGIVVTRKKKEAKEVFIQRLRQCVALRKVKQGMKDWIYILRISSAIKRFKKAVLNLQKEARALMMVKGYRRFLCMLQFDIEVDDCVRQLEKRRNQIMKDRAAADKAGDAEKRKRCDDKLNALLREKGEYRGIPTHVKEEVVDKWTREKEKQYRNKIAEFLRLQDEISKKVKDWVFNRKFVLVSVTNAEMHVTDPRPEHEVALSELRKRGEVPEKSSRPVFPVCTSKPDLVKLIHRAVEISRNIVMKRLARNDLPTPGNEGDYEQPDLGKLSPVAKPVHLKKLSVSAADASRKLSRSLNSRSPVTPPFGRKDKHVTLNHRTI
eukprot:TRINITY_DN19423_c0_g1_i1.p1 TRINITY_DN19423_c0_g1~~TRINITY_DN19423_c0_g1_i1.p1  ORF type:complete len:682 (+),score=166.82 TRINITY_DN19423_c0_g1_i1:84-2129(+)